MAELNTGASLAELAQPQGDATEPGPSVTREPILAFYSQDEVDRFMGKRLGMHRRTTKEYEQVQPLLETLRKEYGCDSNEELTKLVLGQAEASGLRYGIGATTPEEWATFLQACPDADPLDVANDPKVKKAVRAGYTLKEAYKIASLLKEETARPLENGTARHRSSIRMDVSRLTEAQMNEIARRVKRGETIQF